PHPKSDKAPRHRAVSHTHWRGLSAPMIDVPCMCCNTGERCPGITAGTHVSRVIPPGDFFVFLYVWKLTDEALLAGFSVGDPVAAETFIARFQSRVYGIALAIT